MKSNNHTPESAFGAALAHYRLAAGLTQQELGERAGLSRLTISALERGVRHTPHKDTVHRLAEALQLSGRDLAHLESTARRYNGVAGAEPLSADDSIATMVGRETELDWLEHHIDGAGPPLLALMGEPGIGKTILLRASGRYAGIRGMRVLQGGGDRRREQDSFAPVSEALAAELRAFDVEQLEAELWLQRCLPELMVPAGHTMPKLPAGQEQRLIFDAIHRRLSTAQGHPGNGMIMVLDDLQWAGDDALELLAYLARMARQVSNGRQPIRMIVAFRDTETPPEHAVSRMLGDLLPGGLATLMPVKQLDETVSIELVRSLMPAADEETQAEIARRSGGNPFFLHALAVTQHTDTEELPPQVIQTVGVRLASLPVGSREVLEMAAVIGEEFEYEALMSVSGLTEEAVVGALDAAVQAQLTRPGSDGESRFASPAIREVVLEGMGQMRRRIVEKRLRR